MENNSIIIINHISLVPLLNVQTIEFILLLIIEIFAIIYTLFLLIYIVLHWQLIVIKALHNHPILLLIIISFFYIILDLPFTINSYRLGYDNPRTVSFCLWWYWIDSTLMTISLCFTATASIQRYFFIFKTHLLRIRRTRWIIHYIPLIFCIIYPPLFYLIIILFYPCKTLNINDSQYCLSPCYVKNPLLLNIDWMINSALPLIIIILATGILVGWMIHSMWNLDHPQLFIWKKQKKLILQLLAFSLVYASGWTPSTVIYLLKIFSLDTFNENQSIIIYLCYMSYFICPLQPFICLFILPEPFHYIKDKVKQILSKPFVTPIVIIQS